MATKPNCKCWNDPQAKMDRELQVDRIGTAFQHSLDQAVNDLSLCNAACPYVAASAVAGIIFWVAYIQRGDGEMPSVEHLVSAEAEVIALSRETTRRFTYERSRPRYVAFWGTSLAT